MRLFFAVVPDAAAQRAAARRARGLRTRAAVRWVHPDDLHVTLRFLGDSDPAAVPALVEAAARAAAGHAPFEAALVRGGAFPSEERPRVLWIGVASGGALAALARDLEAALAELGIEPDARPFRAHLTVGRVRRGDARAAAHALSETPEIARFRVDELVLLRSAPPPDGRGPRYSAVARAPLALRPPR